MMEQPSREETRRAGPKVAAPIILMVLGLLVLVYLSTSRSMLVSVQYSEQTVSVSSNVDPTLEKVGRKQAVREPLDSKDAASKALTSKKAASEQAPNRFAVCRGPDPGVVIPRLRSVQQWHSSRVRHKRSVTLVTQLSIERLEMLENQCSVWPDPIAAVTYVETVQGRILSMQDARLNGSRIEEAASQLSSFHAQMEAHGSCVLDLELVTEDFGNEREAGLYPFNAARNRALTLARTQAVLILDADFVPTPTLVATWKSSEGYKQLMSQLSHMQAIVIPAFQTKLDGTEGKKLAFAAAQGGKARAVQEYRAGNLSGAHLNRSATDHFATNYELWASQDLPYDIKFQLGFEPYVLVSRRFVPWYDERFRGYGWDKKQHIVHMAGLGMTFAGHPSAFAVHVPHRKSPTYKMTKATGQWGRLFELYKQVLREVRKNRFAPVVSFPCQQ